MSTASFFSELWTGAAPILKDTFTTLRDGYVQVEVAKAQNPSKTAQIEKENILGTPDVDLQQTTALSANQYQAASKDAAGTLNGFLGGLPTWSKVLLGLSLAVLVAGVTVKLVR